MKPVSWGTMALGVLAVCSMILMLLTLKVAYEESHGLSPQFNEIAQMATDDERVGLVIKRSAMLQDYISKLSTEIQKFKQDNGNLRGAVSS